MIVTTNTRTDYCRSEYKVITEDMIEELRSVVPLFNERSKVAHILSIEKDFGFDVRGSDGWQTLHITFEYTGNAGNPGHALLGLTRKLRVYRGVRFEHTYNRKEYTRVYNRERYYTEAGQAYYQRYTADNKERIREYYRQYSIANREKIKQKDKVYYDKHRAKICKYGREYYAAHREALCEQRRKKYVEAKLAMVRGV